MQQRKKLSDILNGSSADFKKKWDATAPVEEFKPLPPGTYRCLVANGEPFKAKTGTEGFKIVFEVTTGPFAGRKIWHDLWFSDDALGIAKAGLIKLGIVTMEQLDQPLRGGLIADVKVVLRTDDDGDSRNRVKYFQVIESEVPAADFAPSDVAAPRTREPGDDDDLDDDSDAWDEFDKAADAAGFNWENGEQKAAQSHTSNGQSVTSKPGRGAR